jgi:hypothetical protein
MRYLCLGYMEPGKFEGMTEDERHALLDECFEYNDHLRAAVPFHPRVTTPDVSVSVIRTLPGCLKTMSVGPEAFALSTLSTVPRITIACDKMSWRFAPTTERYFAITSWAVGNTRFG